MGYIQVLLIGVLIYLFFGKAKSSALKMVPVVPKKELQCTEKKTKTQHQDY